MKTKISNLLLVIIWSLGVVKGQNPEPVYSFAKVRKSLDYYKTQKKLWKLEVEKNPQNAKAWSYYYRCGRNLLRLDTTDKRPRKERIAEQNKLIEDMGKAVPESFEYNLVKWNNSGLDESQIKYYHKCVELGKNRTEHLEEVMLYGELHQQLDVRNDAAKRMLDAQEYSPGFLYYCYNLLVGLKPNAVVFTVGDNDTYGLWLLQAKGIRTDVKVINFSLFGIKTYREQVLKTLNLPQWNSRFNDKSVGVDSFTHEYNQLQKEIVQYVAGNPLSRPVYISLTAEEEITKPIADKLYITGLAFEFSNKPLDNMAWLIKNLEQQYLLDYILQPLYFDRSAEIIEECNANYIVPMYKVWKHHQIAGEIEKANKMKVYLLKLLQNRPEEKEILEEINRG